MMTTTIFELNHIYKTYHNDRHALKNINCSISEGEFIFLTGPSGAGKSTLFKILSAQESITSGTLNVFGHDFSSYTYRNIHEYRRKVGMIFQDFKLIPDITNYQNLEIPLKVLGSSRKEINKQISEVADLVGIDPLLLQEYPDTLSGGQQQKIAVARAIIHKPKVILADEPTGNLDKDSSLNILSILHELIKWKSSVIFATHDLSLMSTLNARIIKLKNGEKIEEVFI